ncbi:hypothetical protein [Mucilaginibacter antarcticus]|uniref:Uncharacterized protein n=1 Tax=Mucilaginibacter antarcticus TaxID=1855725 RepID=A0ABW5XLF4_9SPHI
MRLIARLTLFIILFVNTSYKVAAPSVATDFRSFLTKFKTLQLPLTITIDLKKCVRFTKSDNQFVKSAYPNETYSYGILPDTTDSYKLIWLEPSETQMPYLGTFTKSGKFIEKVFLPVGQCGSGCGFLCNEFTRINKDLSFVSVDSITTCKCDINGPIEGTSEKYVLIKSGRVAKDGQITIGELYKKAIEKK